LSNKWSEAQIAMIGAQASKFPSHQTLHWIALRCCVSQVREVVAEVNEKMAAIEDDKNLSAEGRRRACAELAKETLAKLQKILEAAEHEAARRVKRLEEQINAILAVGKPKDQTEAAIASEIRAHLARSKSPAMAALKLKTDPKVVAAVLDVPSFLSGLTEQEAATLRAEAIASTEQQKELDEIMKAVGVCKSAVKSAAGMVFARANVSPAS
jgi:hypothetical protein